MTLYDCCENATTSDGCTYPIVPAPADYLRQPRAPKPHVMLSRGWWYIVDRPFRTWRQLEPITSDARPKLSFGSGV